MKTDCICSTWGPWSAAERECEIYQTRKVVMSVSWNTLSASEMNVGDEKYLTLLMPQEKNVDVTLMPD